MQKSELKAAFSLSTLFALRMLGLFIILPVFTPFAKNLTDATPFLIGMAFGIYGLTQALFQLPLGALSDYFPRKTVIAFGFCLFILGSFVCAYSQSIEGMMLGRALQGMGAIGSTLTALMTDFIRPEMRSKAMAILGITIALSFFTAIMLGPYLSAHIGVKGIFILTGILGIAAIGLLFFSVPTSPNPIINKTQYNFIFQFKKIFFNSQLFTLNMGIFCLHIILTATFMVIPLWITHWTQYLWPLIFSFIFTFGLIGFAEKHKKVFTLYFYAIVGLIIAEYCLFIFHHHANFLFSMSLMLFLLSFNLLEANLPSLVSRLVPIESKGTAMGLFSTCQFLGIFCGGLLGGMIEQYSSSTRVLLSCAMLSFLWLILTLIIRHLRSDSWQEV